MIATLIIIVLAFGWLLYETDFLRIRLESTDYQRSKALQSKSEGIKTESNNNLPILDSGTHEINGFPKKAQSILNTELDFDGIKTKPKAVKIGYGIFNAKIIKELINLIPQDAEVQFKSYPYEPAYREYTDDGYIPHSETPAKLECIWVNGSKARWTLNSGYSVSYYEAEHKDEYSKG